MEPRRLDVFFYGLFMDRAILEAKGINPLDIRIASVRGFTLRIGSRATLVPAAPSIVHGLLMKLSHSDLQALYSEASVQAYRPEPVLATTIDGETVAALCYTLPEPPGGDEHSPEYAAKLRALAERIGLPRDYIASIN